MSGTIDLKGCICIPRSNDYLAMVDVEGEGITVKNGYLIGPNGFFDRLAIWRLRRGLRKQYGWPTKSPTAFRYSDEEID